mgnify:CR=1 FL=1
MSALKDMREAIELAIEYNCTVDEALEMMYGDTPCSCEDYPCCGH